MAESDNNDHQIASSIEDTVKALRLKLSDLSCDSCASSTKPDFENKLDEISDWVKEQKKDKEKPKEMSTEDNIENVGTVLLVTINSIDKFKSQDPLEITRGVLDIISTVGKLVAGPNGPIIGAICSVIGEILTKSKPQQTSLVDQLANAVHDELVHLKKELQDQKYAGLGRRVSDQKAQLLVMKPGEKLDDPNLWNDYVQFMGELSNRFESPLPFKYEDNLTAKDPDVADFVTAVVTYCQAYSCFMALLTAAKGRFADLGTEYKDDEDVVDRKISCQRGNTKEKLSFLSEEKYLTFLGRLPYEGGKLTKIVVLSRNMRGKSLVEAVRCSLDLPQMQEPAAVESAATKVSRQSVKINVEGHQIHPENRVRRVAAVAGITASIGDAVYSRAAHLVQFINETDFPMKIASGRVGMMKSNLEYVQDIEPRSSCWKNVSLRAVSFSTGGYLIIYLNGIPSSDAEPPAGNARVIEFAMSSRPLRRMIEIQDKTCHEFTRGQGTYDMMMDSTAGEAKSLYWFDRGKHFMARGEIARGGAMVGGRQLIWRFVVQEFDPLAEQDLSQ